MKYKAIIFDFDYTLVDSSRGIVTCFQQVLQNNAYSDIPETAIKMTIGKTLEEAFTVLTGVTDTDTIERWRKSYVRYADQYMTVNTWFFPSTLSVLHSLKKCGLKIGIVSTKYRYRIIDFTSQFLPVDWFDFIVGGEDCTKHKPNPEGLQLAMHNLNVSPGAVLYVGDSTVDAEAAMNAGVDFVGVTTGMTTALDFEPYPSVAILDSLNELMPIIE